MRQGWHGSRFSPAASRGISAKTKTSEECLLKLIVMCAGLVHESLKLRLVAEILYQRVADEIGIGKEPSANRVAQHV